MDLGGGPLGSTFYAPNVLNNDPHGEKWNAVQCTGVSMVSMLVVSNEVFTIHWGKHATGV